MLVGNSFHAIEQLLFVLLQRGVRVGFSFGSVREMLGLGRFLGPQLFIGPLRPVVIRVRRPREEFVLGQSRP